MRRATISLLWGIVGFFVLFFTAPAAAATPPTILTYQGKLTNNNVSVSSAVSMKFVLYDAATNGSALYTAGGTLVAPSAISVTPTAGLFSVDLGGAGTNILDPSIFQNNQSIYLEITINGETLSPRKRITSAPFAFNAAYLNGVAATSTASSSTYIPISDANGNFNFRGVTTSNFSFTNATGTHITVDTCTGCGFFNILNFGAVGDGVTDDAPAFQRALDAMYAAGGGTLIVPPNLPNGTHAVYAWKSAVTEDFSPNGMGPHGSWYINGSGAQVLVTSTPGNAFIALSIYNATSFTIQGMRFYGVINPVEHFTVPNPVKNVIYSSATEMKIIDSQFNGFYIEFPNPNPGGLMGTNAVIYGDSLIIDNCIFASNGGSGRPVVKAENWSNFIVDKTVFADFYFIDNVQYAPMSGDQPFSSIFTANPLPPANGNADSIYGGNRAIISNSRFDEGQGYYTIYIGGLSVYTKQVVITGNNQNVNPANASVGIYLYKVRHATIENNYQREGGLGSKGITGNFVDDVVLRQNYVESGSVVSNLNFDATVTSVKIIDSDYATSTGALYTHVENTGSMVVPGTLAVASTTLIGTTTAPSAGYRLFVDAASSSRAGIGVNGYIRASGYITGTTTLDVAELYPISSTCQNNNSCPTKGDVVCLALGEVAATIERCHSPYDSTALGVISTDPGFSLGGFANDANRQVALAGRVPVLVSAKNGPIAVGDHLTTSDIDGVAMKATKSGPTVGIALEGYSGEGMAKILMFAKTGWWGSSGLDESNSSVLNGSLESFLSAFRNIGVTISQGFVQAAEFVADKITTKTLCVGTVCFDENEAYRLKQLINQNQNSISSVQSAPPAPIEQSPPVSQNAEPAAPANTPSESTSQ